MSIDLSQFHAAFFDEAAEHLAIVRAIPTAAQLIAELPALDLPPANLPG